MKPESIQEMQPANQNHPSKRRVRERPNMRRWRRTSIKVVMETALPLLLQLLIYLGQSQVNASQVSANQSMAASAATSSGPANLQQSMMTTNSSVTSSISSQNSSSSSVNNNLKPVVASPKSLQQQQQHPNNNHPVNNKSTASQTTTSASSIKSSTNSNNRQQFSSPSSSSSMSSSANNSPAFNSRQLKQGSPSTSSSTNNLRQQTTQRTQSQRNNSSISDMSTQMAADESQQQQPPLPDAPHHHNNNNHPPHHQPMSMLINADADQQRKQIRDKMRSLDGGSSKQQPMTTTTGLMMSSAVADSHQTETEEDNVSSNQMMMHMARQTGSPMNALGSEPSSGHKSPSMSSTSARMQSSPTSTKSTSATSQWQTVASSAATIASPAAGRARTSAPQRQEPAAASQLERPSGYSYESPAAPPGNPYTHTTQLNPIKQEVMALAEQAASMAPRQRQLNYSGRSPIGSSTTMNQQFQQQQQVEQVRVPVQQPQFGQPFRQQQPPPITSGVMQAPQSSITGTPLSPCKPPFHLSDQQQQQLNSIQLLPNELLSAAASSSMMMAQQQVKYLRTGSGTRLRSQYIFKVIRADSLTDCELACSRANSQLDSCRSFNYRPYFAAENCELSRYDLAGRRSVAASPTPGSPALDTSAILKLEDPAQFEQHTQFDFYALATDSTLGGGGGQPLAGQQSQQQIVQQQLYGGPFGAALDAGAPECLDVSQSCAQDGSMEFTLRTQEPFHGRIYTYGFYESCFVDGDGSTTSVLRISRSNGFPRCGTQLIGSGSSTTAATANDQLMATNIVVVQFNDYVQTTRDKKYNLTCYLSGPGESVVTSNYLDTKVDERSHPIQIEHLPPQNVVTSNVHLRVLYRGQPTNTIAVGDLLTFRLETSGGGGHLTKQHSGQLQRSEQPQLLPTNEIFATNVIAKDPYSGRQVQLIDARGCPVDPVNVFPELQRTPDGALESEFYAFKIPDSNFLIFQATVRTCKSPCEPVICQTAAAGSQASPNGSSQQQVTSGTKSSSSASLGAYLMAPHQSSAPSWGRKRRRRRRRRQAVDEQLEPVDDERQPVGPGELLVSGESVEHIIPARLAGRPGGRTDQQSQQQQQQLPVVRTVVKRRPDLSEAEEEVKEMFRVYLSRAEMDVQKQRQLAAGRNRAAAAATSTAQLLARPVHHLQDSIEQVARPGLLVSSDQGQPEEVDSGGRAGEGRPLLESSICLTPVSYYVLLFSIISLSLISISTLVIFAYISRRAKFHISQALADSIF